MGTGGLGPGRGRAGGRPHQAGRGGRRPEYRRLTAHPCSLVSLAGNEPQVGTGPSEHRFLLVEIIGPWTRQAVAGSWPERSRLSHDDSAELTGKAEAAGLRLLAIRRADRHRHGDDGERVWGLADVRPGRRGLVWGSWTEGAQLLDLDLAAELDHADRPGAVATRPAALVCTHGGRDACCAVLGRPLLATLDGLPGLDVWECSHLGGHRFAGNLLMLPSGLLYGRVDAGAAGRVADAELAGRLHLPLLRGRSGGTSAQQAAEILARQEWGDDLDAGLRVGDAVAGSDGGWRVELDRVGPDGAVRSFVADLGVRVGRSGIASCGTAKTEPTSEYHLLSLSPVGLRPG